MDLNMKTRKELFQKLKALHFDLGKNYNAKSFFNFTNSRLRLECSKLEDELESTEEYQDMKRMVMYADAMSWDD